MKLEEAIKIIKKEYPGYNLVSVIDYDNYFVFDITPPKYDVEKYGAWLGGLVAVDKLFKLTMHFIPLEYDVDEYRKAAQNIKYF